MSIINKLLSNSLIIAIVITCLAVMFTTIPTLCSNRSWKFQYLLCVSVLLLLSIVVILVVHQSCYKENGITGGSAKVDYSDIFNIPTQFNQF